MSTFEVIALVYLVAGLVLGALVFHSLSGGWDDDMARSRSVEARTAAEVLSRLRRERPGPYGAMVGVLCLMAVLAWPVAAVVLGVPWRPRR